MPIFEVFGPEHTRKCDFWKIDHPTLNPLTHRGSLNITTFWQFWGVGSNNPVSGGPICDQLPNFVVFWGRTCSSTDKVTCRASDCHRQCAMAVQRGNLEVKISAFLPFKRLWKFMSPIVMYFGVRYACAHTPWGVSKILDHKPDLHLRCSRF